MLNSMIESGECHTTRTKEMVNNAQNGLEQLRQYNVSGQSEQLPCPHCGQLEPCAGNSPETCYHPKVC